MQCKFAAAALIGVGCGCGAADAGAVYSFESLTANGIGSPEIAETQISMTVSDLGLNQVSFVFDNVGPDASAIANIYFDGDALTDLLSIVNGMGVSFSEGGAPPDLPAAPGGFSADFRASAGPPPPFSGINPGETLEIIMEGDYADVVSGLDSGSILVGMHVIAFANGASESIISVGVVPAPGALALLGLAGLAGRRRRRG